jgi:hypothetical protein
MCTYLTTTTELNGSGRDRGSWFPLDGGVVYYDHPQDALVEHALCIDFRGRDGQRIAVELDARSAARLARSILDTLADPEVRMLEPDLDDDTTTPAAAPA